MKHPRFYLWLVALVVFGARASCVAPPSRRRATRMGGAPVCPRLLAGQLTGSGHRWQAEMLLKGQQGIGTQAKPQRLQRDNVLYGDIRKVHI